MHFWSLDLGMITPHQTIHKENTQFEECAEVKAYRRSTKPFCTQKWFQEPCCFFNTSTITLNTNLCLRNSSLFK